MSVPCSLVVICWERADLLAPLCVIISCVFVTFPYVLGQVWYLFVSIPDRCLLPYFEYEKQINILFYQREYSKNKYSFYHV